MRTGQAPRVFVSYSHDSEPHAARVLALVQRLRGDGIDAWLDRFVSSPEQGWPRWMQDEVEKADFVVLVCTATYRTRFEGRAEAGSGRGVNFEGVIAGQLLYDGKLDHARVIAVLFEREEVDAVPLAVRPSSRWVLDAGYSELLGHLRGSGAVTPVALGVPLANEGMPEQMSLADQLSVLEEQLELRTVAEQDVTQLRAAILDLRRRIRAGPSVSAGEVLRGRYRLIDEVGRGGFATVWRAYDLRTRTAVAVKLLHGHHVRDGSSVERFIKGAERMAALSHPGVVRIVERPTVHDQHHHFFVMKWCAGGDLRRVRDRQAALAAIADALDGLVHAHEQGFVHRDVKPGNILLDERGHGLISDFDLVRAEGSTDGTKTGAGMGSFVYAAPEQLQAAAQVDARADVYGAAMTVAYALTGVDPPVFPLLTNPGYVDALACGLELRAALRGALGYDREQRTTTCTQLAAAIRAELSGPIWIVEAEPDAHGRWATLRIDEVSQRMRWIEPGSFMMGSPRSDPDALSKEMPQHRIVIGKGFWLADTPCTQALWEAVMGSNPSSRKSPRWPVTDVSWTEVQTFLFTLDALLPSFGAALPTEAQWEYACRAGTSGPTYGDIDEPLGDIAWFDGNSGRVPHDVATKRCNPWGLFDMLGNVWEWCADGKRAYGQAAVQDPVGPGSSRIVRGGGCWSIALHVRAAYRSTIEPGERDVGFGFRIARRQGLQ